MELSYIDTSNFLRSLLVLIKKDNVIHTSEVKLLKSIGEELGFEKEFYEATVEEFLLKKKIDISIPKFSSQKVTIKFIYDSIKMGFIDNYFHIKELNWLYDVASKNKIPTSFVDKKLVEYLTKYPEKKNELDKKCLKKLEKNYDI